ISCKALHESTTTESELAGLGCRGAARSALCRSRARAPDPTCQLLEERDGRRLVSARDIVVSLGDFPRNSGLARVLDNRRRHATAVDAELATGAGALTTCRSYHRGDVREFERLAQPPAPGEIDASERTFYEAVVERTT